MENYVELKSPFTGGKVKEVSTTEEHEFRTEKLLVHVRYYVCEDTGERFTTTEQDELLFNLRMENILQCWTVMIRCFPGYCKFCTIQQLIQMQI